MNIKIKLYTGGKMPLKATAGSAAYDVFTPYDYTVQRGRQVLPLEFAVEIPCGYEMKIEPRSGFASKGIEGCIKQVVEQGRVVRTIGHDRYDCDVLTGKIDSDYRGVVGVILNNHGRPFLIPKGTRIAQMTIYKVEQADFEAVTSLSSTDRADGGFGHTGAL